MRVSVLIPTYNRALYVCDAIESVLSQSYGDYEIVVVDDGSTDGTAELVRRYPNVRYVRQNNMGIPCARNRALAESRGELITWLDSDDLYTQDKLEKQVAYLDTYQECQIVFCLPKLFSDIPFGSMTTRQKLMIQGDSVSRIYLAGACIRRTLYDLIGGYNESYDVMEDTEWEVRCRLNGINLAHCIDEYLYMRRVHKANVTFSHESFGKDRVYGMYADVIRRNMIGVK